jgi:hypothetical protein
VVPGGASVSRPTKGDIMTRRLQETIAECLAQPLPARLDGGGRTTYRDYILGFGFGVIAVVLTVILLRV